MFRADGGAWRYSFRTFDWGEESIACAGVSYEANRPAVSTGLTFRVRFVFARLAGHITNYKTGEGVSVPECVASAFQ